MQPLFLTSDDELTTDMVESGVVTWDDLIRSVKSFHYGRNSNRNDLSLVWYERKGTCSSKHAFLKQVALLNKLPNVKLIMAFYKMNGINTPGLADILTKHNIDYIPEAHCYLLVNNEAIDVTHINSKFEKYEQDIMEFREIMPNDVVVNKVEWHKEFLKKWQATNELDITLDELWSIREECIKKLEDQN